MNKQSHELNEENKYFVSTQPVESQFEKGSSYRVRMAKQLDQLYELDT